MMNLKIIVDGVFSAGKTEFIRAASEQKVVTVDVPINLPKTYIGMDYGVIEGVDDTIIILLGTPSAIRFSFDWPVTKNSLIGYVIMVDSAYPGTFREAKSILEVFRAYCREPYVVVANKQDKEGAWEIDDLRRALNLRKEIPVLPCVTSDKESVKRVLVALLDKVLKVLITGESWYRRGGWGNEID